MAIPAQQLDPISRKLGSKKRQRPKKAARRKIVRAIKPSSTTPPPAEPPKIYGRPPTVMLPRAKRVLDHEGLRTKGIFYSASHLRRLWMRDEFPRPFHLTPRRLAWNEADIDAWLEEKAREQQGREP